MKLLRTNTGFAIGLLLACLALLLNKLTGYSVLSFINDLTFTLLLSTMVLYAGAVFIALHFLTNSKWGAIYLDTRTRIIPIVSRALGLLLLSMLILCLLEKQWKLLLIIVFCFPLLTLKFLSKYKGLSAITAFTFFLTCFLIDVLYITPKFQHFHSALFSWYLVASFILMFFAAFVITMLKDKSLALNKPLLLEVGRYLFGILCFWFYLWFCQYLLIWYGNLPGENGFYIQQMNHSKWIFFAALLSTFVIPFLLLFMPSAKTKPVILKISSVFILVGQIMLFYLLFYSNQAFSGFLFSKYLLLVLAVLAFLFNPIKKKLSLKWASLLMVFFLISCNNNRTVPGYSYYPDMKEPLIEYKRMPPKHSVPINTSKYTYNKSAGGRKEAGINLFADSSFVYYPDRAKELYTNYCLLCHGLNGDGKGYLVTSGKYPYKASSLLSPTVQVAPEGEIFHVISVGWNMMGAHAAMLTENERWQIVKFVKQLPKYTTP